MRIIIDKITLQELRKMAKDDFIEFDSMINLKPSQGNRSRGVDDSAIQKRSQEIVQKKVTNS